MGGESVIAEDVRHRLLALYGLTEQKSINGRYDVLREGKRVATFRWVDPLPYYIAWLELYAHDRLGEESGHES